MSDFYFMKKIYLLLNTPDLNFTITFRWESHKKAYVDAKKSDNLSVETIAEGVEKVRM